MEPTRPKARVLDSNSGILVTGSSESGNRLSIGGVAIGAIGANVLPLPRLNKEKASMGAKKKELVAWSLIACAWFHLHLARRLMQLLSFFCRFLQLLSFFCRFL